MNKQHINPSSNIKQNSKFLIQLGGAYRSKKLSNTLLQKASSQELLSIVEICWNILRERLPITVKQRKQLIKKAPLIRKISRIRSEKSAKNLFQTGRGIPAAAALVASLIIPLLSEIISKKNEIHHTYDIGS